MYTLTLAHHLCNGIQSSSSLQLEVGVVMGWHLHSSLWVHHIHANLSSQQHILYITFFIGVAHQVIVIGILHVLSQVRIVLAGHAEDSQGNCSESPNKRLTLALLGQRPQTKVLPPPLT